MKKFFFTYYGILAAIILALMAFGAFGDEVLTLDERIVALTLLGEARGEGVDGMLAVGMVVQQRSIERKKRPATICLQPKQFSCWNGMGIRQAERKWFTEDKKATVFETSSPVPSLDMGILDVKTDLILSMILSVILDWIKPGETQVIVIFFFAYSIAKLFDIPIIPAFDAA